MNIEYKAEHIDQALKQLAAEIAGDIKTYDTPTALLAVSAIDSFLRNAPAESKARLFDIVKGA